MSFNVRKLARNEQIDRIFMFMKIFWPQGVVCPCPGAIYNIHTSCFWKRPGQSKPNFMWSKLGRGNESLRKYVRSHDQDGHHGYT